MAVSHLLPFSSNFCLSYSSSSWVSVVYSKLGPDDGVDHTPWQKPQKMHLVMSYRASSCASRLRAPPPQ